MHSELIIHDKAMDKSAWGNENIDKRALGIKDKMSNEASKSSTNPAFGKKGTRIPVISLAWGKRKI